MLRHKLSIKKYSGFTLIELLLYVVISGAMMLTISVMLTQVLQVRAKNRAIAEVDQQGTQVTQLMTQAIRNATTISTPAPAVSGSTLTMVVPTGANSPTTFDLSGGVLRIKEGAGATVNITSSKVTVSSLTFSNYTRGTTPGIVRIQFTISAVNNSGRNEFSYQKSFIASASVHK